MPRFLLLLALSLAPVLAPEALAGEGKMGRIADEVGLDDKQRAAVEDILYKSNLSKVEAKARLQKAKLELQHSLTAATLDEKAVKTSTDAAAAAAGDLVRIRVERIVAIRKQLSAEQWDKLEGMWQDRDEDEDEDDDE
jgi:Spy/CpxP family protein refolding chaperone